MSIYLEKEEFNKGDNSTTILQEQFKLGYLISTQYRLL